MKGAEELFEIFVNSRYNINNIPVDEDQEVPEPKDSSISKHFNTLGPNNCKYSQDNRVKFLRSTSSLISELRIGLEQLWRKVRTILRTQSMVSCILKVRVLQWFLRTTRKSLLVKR